MTKKFFFLVTTITFGIFSVLHFLRLMFEWQVFVGTWRVPGYVSGIVILFTIFMVYWSIDLNRKELKEEKLEGEIDTR